MSCCKFRNIPPLDDCPVCKKENGAYMGSSEWGHNISCCSDNCGKEMRKRLMELRNSKKMKKLQERLNKIKIEIHSEVNKIASNAGMFELENWL